MLGRLGTLAETKTTGDQDGPEGAQSYASGHAVNGQYKEYTQTKIEMIEEDVNDAHRRLYDRQAPLLDWPDEVEAEITTWGREIPEGVPENQIQEVAYVYTDVYDDYAEQVYETFDPWDPATGEGIVVAPPMEALLALPTFNQTTFGGLPSLAKIWQFQENLWVRESILEVIAAGQREGRRHRLGVGADQADQPAGGRQRAGHRPPDQRHRRDAPEPAGRPGGRRRRRRRPRREQRRLVVRRRRRLRGAMEGYMSSMGGGDMGSGGMGSGSGMMMPGSGGMMGGGRPPAASRSSSSRRTAPRSSSATTRPSSRS